MARPWQAGGGPSEEQLRELIESGATHKQIAEQFGVSRPTVGYWVKKAGLNKTSAGMSHKDYLPWDIKAEDHHDSIARALRWYSTQQQGGDLDIVARREVERLTEFLKKYDVVVDYDRDTGFCFRHRKRGVDRGGDIIRRPAA